jgi:group I intron endonuclease
MNFVYVISNNQTKKRYVGLSNNVAKRWKEHVRHAFDNCTTKYLLHQALVKYGVDSFSLSVLEEYELRDDALRAEARLIKELDTFGPNGYNMTGGWEGALIVSENTRTVISESQKRRFASVKEREKHSNACKGSLRSEETKKRISECQKGRKHTTHSKMKMSLSRKGIKFSEERKQKMRDGWARKKVLEKEGL